jgi:hypothetical protein
MFVIRDVIKRGMDHKIYCEDSSLSVIVDEKFAIIAAFDGCSTGVKSHFASELYAKLFKKCLDFLPKFDANTNVCSIKSLLIEKFYYELLVAKVNLKLDFTEMLSTFVLAVIDTALNEGTASISGDGLLFIDGIKALDIDCPENAPNYMIYQIENGMSFHTMYDTTITHHMFHFTKTVAVTSDGMHTFKSLTPFDKKEVFDFLIVDENLLSSPAMLKRKCTMLENKGIIHTDDLTIVRLIKQ